MYIYHCFRSYDWEETLVFTGIGLYRPIYGPCIHQCIFFACTFVNLPESVKIFTGNTLVTHKCWFISLKATKYTKQVSWNYIVFFISWTNSILDLFNLVCYRLIWLKKTIWFFHSYLGTVFRDRSLNMGGGGAGGFRQIFREKTSGPPFKLCEKFSGPPFRPHEKIGSPPFFSNISLHAIWL